MLLKTNFENLKRSYGSNIPKDCKSGNYEGALKKVQPNYRLLACLVKKNGYWWLVREWMNFHSSFVFLFKNEEEFKAPSQNFQICRNDSSLYIMCQFVSKVEENGHKCGVPFAFFFPFAKTPKKSQILFFLFLANFSREIKVNKRYTAHNHRIFMNFLITISCFD